MDLFVPVNIMSISKEKKNLSCDCWWCFKIHLDFLPATKNEAGQIIINHINALDNNPEVKVGRIKTDNRTEFKNVMMKKFCEGKGIVHEFSAPRTPQQNGVVERKNRTLIEAARTMLNEAQLPT